MIKYLKIRLFLTGVFLPILAFSSIQTANSTLTGKVVEKSSKTPMEYANVVLYETKDSTMVEGTITNENGIFKFSNLSNGSYYLQISYIGFETLKTKSFILMKNRDFGSIAIKVRPVAFGEVEVVADKSTFNNTIDRKVYNIEKDVASQTGSVSDLLQNIPSVSVEVDGTISLRGSSNVTIFINGKPSLLMRKNSSVVLQQMPANSVKRIEVITNPSAKYKPDGVGGIINIVLKKESRQGINGTLLANVGNMSRYNTNAMLNYNPGKINLFGSYGIRRHNSQRISTSERINKDSLSQVINYYDNNSSSYVKPMTHIGNLGLDFLINEKNKVGLLANYFYADSYHKQNSNTTFRDAEQHINTDFSTDRTNDEFEKEFEISSNFEHKSEKEDHVLSLELNYAGYDEQEDLHYDESYTVPTVFDAQRHFLIRKGGQLAEFYTEYVNPIDEDTEIEAGYVGEFMRDDIRYFGEDYDVQQNSWITDFNKTNRFKFHQDIHALYATFAHSIEDFSFLAGLRAEQAVIKSNLVSADSTIPNNYFKIYPTLHLAYELNNNQQFQLNYSRRVRRADSDEHNPFAEYSDPRNMEAGNPKIKPEQIHSVEFGYHYKEKHISVLPSFYYRYKYDAFTEIYRYVNDSTMLTTFTNMTNDQSSGMEFIVSADVKKFMSLNFSADVFYQVIDASNLGYSEKKSTVTWNAKLATNFHMMNSNLVQINAHYRSVKLTPQGRRLPLFLLNLGLRQDLFNQKVSHFDSV